MSDTYEDDGPPPRLVPHNTAAERSLIGAWLLSTAARAHHVDPDDFYHPHHRHIAAAIQHTEQAGHPVDHVTVNDQLERTGRLAACGGPSTLASLIADVPATTSAGRYAAIIRRDAHERRLLRACANLTEALYALDPDEQNTAARRLVELIAEQP